MPHKLTLLALAAALTLLSARPAAAAAVTTGRPHSRGLVQRCPYAINDPVAVVDRIEQRPLVERCARVARAKTDQIADLQRDVAFERVNLSVLVIQCHGGSGGGGALQGESSRDTVVPGQSAGGCWSR